MTPRFIADVVRARQKDGITNATIRRDLVAISSVCTFAMAQGWRDDNPTLPAMTITKEKRMPIVLPQAAHLGLVISRCPGMIADLVRAALATGAREDELLSAEHHQVNHHLKELLLVGKGRGGVKKTRVIDLVPFGGHALITGLTAYVGSPLLFWHGEGESYKRASSPRSSRAPLPGRSKAASISGRSVSTTCATYTASIGSTRAARSICCSIGSGTPRSR